MSTSARVEVATRSNPLYGKIEVVACPETVPPDADIIFVHGLELDWVHAWPDRDRQISWLTTLLPHDLPKVRVLTFGLNIIKQLKTDPRTVERASQALIDGLKASRSDNDRPIIFVAHSIGGVLLRSALLASAARTVRDALIGVIFMGTPSLQDSETDIVRWSKTINSICQSIKIEWTPSEDDIMYFAHINTRFRTWIHGHSAEGIVCFYETLPRYRIGVIVPKDVATLSDCESFPIEADHLDMKVISSMFDSTYQTMVKKIKSQINMSKGMTGSIESLTQEMKGSRTPTPYPSLRPKSPFPDGREVVIASSGNVSELAKKYASLALALEDHGQFEGAEQAYERAMKEYKDSLGSRNEIYLFCLDKAASVLRDRSMYSEAEAKAKEAWYARIDTLGASSTAALSSAGNLARIMRYQGRYKSAFILLADALDATEGSPFYTISGTAAVSILAKILKELGMYQVSELLSRDVVRACSVMLGRDHPFTLNRESDLAVVLSKRGNFQAAEAVGHRALDLMEKTMGTDHPHTLRTAKRVANYMRFQGRYAEALPLLKRTLDMQEQLLEPTHPDCLSTKCSLAAVYALQDDFALSARLLQKALEERIEAFNADHPDVIWTRNALQAVFRLTELYTAHDIAQKDHEQFDANVSSNQALKNDGVLKEIREKKEFLRSPTRPSVAQVENETAAFDELYQSVPTFDSDGTAAALSTDTPQRKALRVAATAGQVEIVEGLLNDFGNPDAQRYYYTNALHPAAYSGNVQIVEMLLSWSKEHGQVSGSNVYGAKILESALRVASIRGNLSVVRALLQAGAKINSGGGFFGTALQAASYSGHTELVQLLLETSTLKVDIQAGLFGFALRSSALRGHLDIVKLLISKHASPNAQDDRLSSALQAAWIRKHTHVAEALLEADADVNSLDASFGTPLQEASWTGDTALVALLLDRGADPNLHSGVIGSALEMAASANHREIVERLIDSDPDVEIEGYGSALQAAAIHGHVDVVRALLDRGKGKEIEGYSTAIQAALAAGHKTVMRVLLDRATKTLEESGLNDSYAQKFETLSSSRFSRPD